MKLSIDGFVRLLRSSRTNHGWRYGFGRQIGTINDGDIRTIYYRHVLVGVPPPEFKPPSPIWTWHLWIDACVYYCHFGQETQVPIYMLGYLGMPSDDAKKLIGAAAECRGFDVELRARLLRAAGVQEIPIAERELPECHPNFKPGTKSTFQPISRYINSSTSSARPRPRVTISVPRAALSSKKTSP